MVDLGKVQRRLAAFFTRGRRDDERVGPLSAPVVDEREGLVGIVSYVDLLRCFLHRLRED